MILSAVFLRGVQATTRASVNASTSSFAWWRERLYSGRHFFHAAREQVRLCLSGLDERLRNSVNFAILRTSFARERVSTMSEEAVKITVRPNGPLRVEGHILLTDADGKQWDLTGKPAVSLCRCGASERRPFCDGSHNRVGFQCAASPAEILT